MDISTELKSILLQNGAALVGFADLGAIPEVPMPHGVSIAVSLPVDIVKSIHDGPNLEYYNTYLRLNNKLDELVTRGAEFLKESGYSAIAQTVNSVIEYEGYRTILPHKTVATRAGLGWIGKSALLVTPEYGSAVRISSIITNAPLDCAKPINEPKCGNCMICSNACPAGAISGKNWSISSDRDDFYNANKCRETARRLSMERFDIKITMCGKCIEVCPYTAKYINT